MATKKTAAPKASPASTKLADKVFGMSPRRPAAAKAVKAGQDPATAKAQAIAKDAAKKPAAKRSAPAKAEAVTLTGSKDGIPTHVVKNLKGLREAMDKHPKATGYSTDRKFGIDIVNLHNTRGRVVAEIKLISKAK
jgi:hypothetical protein